MKPISIDPRATLEGRLVKRYKRFLADVELTGGARDGEIVTVHCPNPGSMRGTDRPGARVRCSTSDNPKRKLAHTLEMIRVGRIWVGLHTLRANELARAALEAAAVPGLEGYAHVKSEVRVEPSISETSRLDFLLSEHVDWQSDAYVEVKSVTMAERERGLFPDAVTERGRKHLDVLERLADTGRRAVMLFVVQRGDCASVSPADEIDAAYGETLRRVADAGVELIAVRARVTARRIRLESTLPVLL